MDWLGSYLESYRGTVMIISHDRWFIDQCCDRVIEIHDCTCDFYNGNYSYYAVERERRREEQLKHHEHELAEKKRLEATARSMHEHGTEHLAKRAASIEKRIARMKVTDRPKTDKKMTVTFGDPNYETEEVLKVRDITKSYDGREILHDVSFNIRNRERVALLGANGAGKTTMLKILLGEETPDSGVIRKGVGLKPGVPAAAGAFRQSAPQPHRHAHLRQERFHAGRAQPSRFVPVYRRNADENSGYAVRR